MLRTVRRIRRSLTIRRDEARIVAYREIDGFLSPYEAVALYQLAAALPPGGTILEIGSWKGKSTYCLARGLQQGKVFAIDPFDAAGEPGSHELYLARRGSSTLREQFEQRMNTLGVLDKIVVLQGYSTQYVGHVPRIDLLFIDGDHSIHGTGFDYLNYEPFLASGGYIAFHDYYPERKDLGPTWVIENKVLPSGRYMPRGRYDSLWVGQKK